MLQKDVDIDEDVNHLIKARWMKWLLLLLLLHPFVRMNQSRMDG
jgi:hypothetical protein